MEASDFNKLNLQKKGSIVFNEAKYLGVRFYYNYAINLYTLDDLFIEVWYFKPTNRIEKIEVLGDNKTLDLYIDSMNNLRKSN